MSRDLFVAQTTLLLANSASRSCLLFQQHTILGERA
jgi:hypothetical protein